MTGYGRAEIPYGAYVIRMEIKSVNHRFAEVVLRVPREWMQWEDALRRRVLSVLRRGRAEVYGTISREAPHSQTVVVNEALLATALRTLYDVTKSTPIDFTAPSLGHLLALPNLFQVAEGTATPEGLEQPLLHAVAEALDALQRMRCAEGERLQEHLTSRLQDVKGMLTDIRASAAVYVDGYEQKLVTRLRQGRPGLVLDADRVALEVAMVAERISMEEEIVRMESHVQQFETLLDDGEAVGRRMDFLLQEMHREVNTMGAKCADPRVMEVVLSARHAVEQLREQVQNVE